MFTLEDRLNKAEILFYKGNYEGARNLVLEILEKMEPGIKNKFIKECCEQESL